MFIPLLATIILLSASLHAMENNEIAEYGKRCQIIKKTLKAEKNDFLEMVYNKQLDPAQELTRIEQQFTYYKNKLIKEEEASLLQLKNFHNIGDDDWAWCINLEKNMLAAVKNNINNGPDALHDPHFFGKNKIILAQYLHKYGLNIKKINIRIAENNLSNPCLQSRIESPCSLAINDDEPIAASINNQEIILYNPQKLSSSQIKGLLIIAAWQFAHISINIGLPYSISKKSNKYNYNVLKQSNEYMIFEKIQYKQAEIFPCLEDYEACQYMENLRTNRVQSHDMGKNRELFQKICTIKNLWEKRTILEKILQK